MYVQVIPENIVTSSRHPLINEITTVKVRTWTLHKKK